MNKSIYRPHYWHYLTGDFLNRTYIPLNKVLPLDQKITSLLRLTMAAVPALWGGSGYFRRKRRL